MEEVVQLTKEEHERLERDAARTCGPHTCSRSRRWKVVAVIALVVMIGFGLDRLYREEARNEQFKRETMTDVRALVDEWKSEVDQHLRDFGQQAADIVRPRLLHAEQQLRQATQALDEKTRQLDEKTRQVEVWQWSALLEVDRMMELRSRVEALEASCE